MLLQPLRVGTESNPHDVPAIIDNLVRRAGVNPSGIQGVTGLEIKIAQGIFNNRVGFCVSGQLQQHIAIVRPICNPDRFMLWYGGAAIGGLRCHGMEPAPL